MTIPPELVQSRTAFLEDELRKQRADLLKEYDVLVKKELKSLPKELLSMTVRDLLQLAEMADYTDTVPSSATKKRRIESRDSEIIDSRRVTRSMARNSSLYIPSTTTTTNASDVPSTPKLHPLLPETPAVLRKAIRLAKASQPDPIDEPSEETPDFKRPVRIARSTIRVVPADDANVFKAPIAPKSRKSVRHSAITTTTAKQEAPHDSTVVSLELSDGKVLDVDLSQSPKTMFKGMGKEAVKEVKSKMQTYAMQLRAFFKKLNF